MKLLRGVCYYGKYKEQVSPPPKACARGEYRNIGETWEWKNGKNWKAARVNPSRQADTSAYRLKNFLKADNVNVFVNSAVIWANLESQLTVENPSAAVWGYDRIPDELGNIWQGEKLSDIDRERL